jgi:hypothetical protein
MEVEEEVCPSPHRDFSPPPPPTLEEMPSSTKAASKKGKNLLFPSSPPAVEIKGKIPFTRSSIPKEVFKEQSLPEPPIQKKKGKSIKNLVEEKSETFTKGRRVKVAFSLLKESKKPLYIRIKVLKYLWREKMKPLRKELRSLW